MTHTHTDSRLFDTLKDFSTISLEELNATMSLMERVETKYLISLDKLGDILESFLEGYSILSIKGNSIFTYDNIYMDTNDFMFYHQHEEDVRPRMKVRSREYVDSHIAFFECKQRNGDIIRKSRYGISVDQADELSNENYAFYQGVSESFNLPYTHAKLRPTLRTHYKRITLCSKTTDERVTIDFDVNVQNVLKKDNEMFNFGPVAIIETKSSRKNVQSNKIIESFGFKAAHGCSKYCIGLNFVGNITDTKHFANSIDFIQKTKKPEQKIKKKTINKLQSIKTKVIKDIKPTPIKAQNSKIQHQTKEAVPA